jgi:hypothetical protein
VNSFIAIECVGVLFLIRACLFACIAPVCDD